jgi:hypothetical protein
MQMAEELCGYGFSVLLVLAVITARLKVKLPGLTGNMAVNLPFLLIAVPQLSMLEAPLLALSSCGAQCLPKGGGKPKPVQVFFNLSTTGVAAATASLIGNAFCTPNRHGLLFGANCPGGLHHRLHRRWSDSQNLVQHRPMLFSVLPSECGNCFHGHVLHYPTWLASSVVEPTGAIRNLSFLRVLLSCAKYRVIGGGSTPCRFNPGGNLGFFVNHVT